MGIVPEAEHRQDNRSSRAAIGSGFIVDRKNGLAPTAGVPIADIQNRAFARKARYGHTTLNGTRYHFFEGAPVRRASYIILAVASGGGGGA